MHMIAAVSFGLLLVGGLALVASMLAADLPRIAAVLAGAELERARTPPAVRINADRRRAPAPRPRHPLAAAA